MPNYNIHPHLAYPVIDINEDKEFTINFNVNELVNHRNFKTPLNCSCYFLCDGEKISIVSEEIDKHYIFPSNSILRVIPTYSETLIFIINSNPIIAKLNSIDISNDKLSINIETNYSNDLAYETPILNFKCREQKELFKYYNSIDVPLNRTSNSNKDNFNYNLNEYTNIFLQYLNNYEFFDIFFEIKNKIGTISIPVLIDESFNDSKSTSIGYLHNIQPIVSNNQISL